MQLGCNIEEAYNNNNNYKCNGDLKMFHLYIYLHWPWRFWTFTAEGALSFECKAWEIGPSPINWNSVSGVNILYFHRKIKWGNLRIYWFLFLWTSSIRHLERLNESSSATLSLIQTPGQQRTPPIIMSGYFMYNKIELGYSCTK